LKFAFLLLVLIASLITSVCACELSRQSITDNGKDFSGDVAGALGSGEKDEGRAITLAGRTFMAVSFRIMVTSFAGHRRD